MSKVYLNPQKIFRYLASLVIVFGVISCANSQTTVASSGETDGVYYSPSKDGQVEYASNESAKDYDIKVGSAYFDANGNGAEDFYYDEPAETTQDVNIYTGSNTVYVGSGTTTDWGRYDGIDITVNNWGWNDPWWGWSGYYGYNSYWGWSWGWSYPRWHSWYNPYWGGYYGYNPYWGYYNPYYYNPYWGYGSGYYGGYGYYYPGYYYRGTPVRPGVRPGSSMAYSHNPGLSGFRDQRIDPIRSVRTGNSSVRENNVRQVREVRPETGVRNNTDPTGTTNPRPVRSSNDTNNNVRTTAPTNVRNNEPRPVRATRPDGVRPNTPVRSSNQDNTRTSTPPRRNDNVTTPTRNSSPRNNSGIRTSTPPSGNSGSNIRTSSPSPSRSSGSTGGGRRR